MGSSSVAHELPVTPARTDDADARDLNDFSLDMAPSTVLAYIEWRVLTQWRDP